MTRNPWDSPDEWDWHVFIAVVEERSHDSAARRLAAIRGTYTRQAVAGVLEKIERWAGEKLLVRGADRKYHTTERGHQLLEAARKIVSQYDWMRAPSVGGPLPTLACSPHHVHFVALAEDVLRDGDDTAGDGLRVEYLPQEQRGEGGFFRDAVDRLMRDEFQLIIGPQVRDPTLESRQLYSARLEAMIDHEHPEEILPLEDLVTRFRMMVAPRDIRSRRILEEAIVEAHLDDPGPIRVAAETYEAATLVIRLRTERQRPGEPSRVVVVPSDVSLSFKPGMEQAAAERADARRFKWIPITRPAGRGHTTIPIPVYVTLKRNSSARLGPIVEALAEAVQRLRESSGHGPDGRPANGHRRPARRTTGVPPTPRGATQHS